MYTQLFAQGELDNDIEHRQYIVDYKCPGNLKKDKRHPCNPFETKFNPLSIMQRHSRPGDHIWSLEKIKFKNFTVDDPETVYADDEFRLSRTDAQQLNMMYFGQFDECDFAPFNPCKGDPNTRCRDRNSVARNRFIS